MMMNTEIETRTANYRYFFSTEEKFDTFAESMMKLRGKTVPVAGEARSVLKAMLNLACVMPGYAEALICALAGGNFSYIELERQFNRRFLPLLKVYNFLLTLGDQMMPDTPLGHDFKALLDYAVINGVYLREAYELLYFQLEAVQNVYAEPDFEEDPDCGKKKTLLLKKLFETISDYSVTRGMTVTFPSFSATDIEALSDIHRTDLNMENGRLNRCFDRLKADERWTLGFESFENFETVVKELDLRKYPPMIIRIGESFNREPSLSLILAEGADIDGQKAVSIFNDVMRENNYGRKAASKMALSEKTRYSVRFS